jgi:hypothetical protein
MKDAHRCVPHSGTMRSAMSRPRHKGSRSASMHSGDKVTTSANSEGFTSLHARCYVLKPSKYAPPRQLCAWPGSLTCDFGGRVNIDREEMLLFDDSKTLHGPGYISFVWRCFPSNNHQSVGLSATELLQVLPAVHTAGSLYR